MPDNRNVASGFGFSACCFKLCALYSLFLLCCCVSAPLSTDTQVLSGGGQVSVFLEGAEKISADIAFDLSAVNIIAEDGTSREVMSTPLTLRSTSVAGRQVLIGEKMLPEGKYKGLRIIIGQAVVNRRDGPAHLALPPEGSVEVGMDITVRRGQNTSLFLRWSPDTSVVSGYLFSPVFDIKGQSPELSSLLVFVTNEGSDNVSVIHRQTGDVVAVIMVGKKPRGVAVSSGRDRQRVYVANSGSNSISVIDPTVNRVEFEITLRFGKEPEGITVARTASGREFIFVTNYGSGSVSIIDTSTYHEIERAAVGEGPIAISADPPVEAITGSRFLGFDTIDVIRNYRRNFTNVYVANKNSRDISVIKVDARGRVDEVISVGVQWSPIALFVDYPRARVYVANYDYDGLSVIDILQLIAGNTKGAATEISNLGTSVTGVISDPEFDRLYLLKESSGELLIVRPFSEASAGMRTSISPILGSVSVGSKPRALLMDPEGRKIYIVNRGSDTVSVVDKTTRREERVIPVGRKPYGIAMFPE